MFLFAGIVGGIKGLFWSPAHVMRALAACLQVLQTPPAETAPAPGANSVSQSGRIKADPGRHSLRRSSRPRGRCVSLQSESYTKVPGWQSGRGRNPIHQLVPSRGP